MKTNQILESINNYPTTIILVTTKNSNPDNLVEKLIYKFTKLDYSSNLESFVDLIKINGITSSIKKEDVINMKNQLMHSSLNENNIKFYYLKKIENSSKETFNSLLKFIEDENDNTIGIFTTCDINFIPKTIISRCFIYYLDEDEETLNQILFSNNLSNEKWLLNLFNDLEELKIFINSENFEKIKNLYNFFTNINLEKSKSYLEQFKQLTYIEIEILLKAILNNSNFKIYNQILNLINDLKFNPVKSLIFTNLFLIMETL